MPKSHFSWGSPLGRLLWGATSWLLLACAAEGSPTNTTVVAERVVQAKPAASAAQDQAGPANQAERFEHFRLQMKSRLDRHGGDLERLRPKSEVTRVPLQRRFGHAVVARRNADGHLDYGCFSDATEGARFVTNSTASEASQ